MLSRLRRRAGATTPEVIIVVVLILALIILIFYRQLKPIFQVIIENIGLTIEGKPTKPLPKPGCGTPGRPGTPGDQPPPGGWPDGSPDNPFENPPGGPDGGVTPQPSSGSVRRG